MKSGLEGSWRRLTMAFSESSAGFLSSERATSASQKRGRNSESVRNVRNFRCETNQNRSRPQTANNGQDQRKTLGDVPAHFLHAIYRGKCADLGISSQQDQASRFAQSCVKWFSSRKLVLTESGVGLAAAKALGALLRASPFFTELNLSKNMLGDKGVLELTRSLSENSSLVHLDLSSNSISPEGVGPLFTMLASHDSITSVSLASIQGLHRNRLSSKGAASLKILLTNPVLAFLNLAGTVLGPESLPLITGALLGNKTLLSLNISDNNFGPRHIKKFFSAVRSTNMSELDISGNKLENEGAECLGTLLSGPCKLTRLSVSRNGISALGAYCVFSALKNNGILESLVFEGNWVGPRAGSSLSLCLSSNTALKYLRLSDCDLSDFGATSISVGLGNNRGLKTLVLSQNRIGNEGAAALAESLLWNRHLVSLNLAGNLIGSAGIAELANSLRENPVLLELTLASNNVKDEGGELLVELLRWKNNGLALGLANNPMGTKNLLSLKEVAKKHRRTSMKDTAASLKKELDSNRFDHNRISQVCSLLKRKQSEEMRCKCKLDKCRNEFSMKRTQEKQKYTELNKAYEALKVANREKGKEEEHWQMEQTRTNVCAQKLVRSAEGRYSNLVFEIKSLEKLSNSYSGATKREEFNLKRLYLERILQTLANELHFSGLQQKAAQSALESLQHSHAVTLSEQLRLSSPIPRKKSRPLRSRLNKPR